MSNCVENKLRIVCLSHDSIDMLIQLGAHQRVVGRPAGERRPEVAHAASVGGYGSVKTDKIIALNPDVVIAYASFQQRQTEALVDAGINVLTLAHRSISEIFSSMRLLASLTDTEAKGDVAIRQMMQRIETFETNCAGRQPVRVYFEEWDEPMVAAPQWVSEMIALAGGEDVFADRSGYGAFDKRGVSLDELIQQNPDVIVASWCGKPVNRDAIRARAGVGVVEAIRNDRIFEVDGAWFLQPGPSILTGVTILHHLLHPELKGGAV